MNTGALIVALGKLTAQHPIAKPLIKWVSENHNLITEVSENTFIHGINIIKSPNINTVAMLEEQISKLSWEERLDIMKNGIKKIDESSSQRRKEIALMVSLTELGLELLPYLLMVI